MGTPLLQQIALMENGVPLETQEAPEILTFDISPTAYYYTPWFKSRFAR
jgi:hypothetical protein